MPQISVTTKSAAHKIKSILPWLIAAGIFAYLFHLYPPRKIWNALQYVRLETFIPFAIGYFVWIYFVDIFGLAQMFKRFGFSVGLKNLFLARGATYLLMIVNYAAGQLGFAYYLKRTHRIPIWEALSIFFFFIIIDLYWVITLCFAGSFFQDYRFAGVEIKNVIWLVAGMAYCVFFLNILFWRGPLFQKLEKYQWAPLNWIRKKDIFRIFKEATLKDYAKLALLRTPIHISLIISMYIVLKTFDVYIPFMKIFCNIPLVILVGIIPITPGGLGTTNAAMVELLSPYVHGPVFDKGIITPAELLFAASLLWMFANYVFKALTGTFCLKSVSKDLFATPPETQTETEPEPTHLGQNLPL